MFHEHTCFDDNMAGIMLGSGSCFLVWWVRIILCLFHLIMSNFQFPALCVGSQQKGIIVSIVDVVQTPNCSLLFGSILAGSQQRTDYLGLPGMPAICRCDLMQLKVLHSGIYLVSVVQ